MVDEEAVFDALADGHRRQLLVELVTDSPIFVSEPSGSSREISEANEELLQKYLSKSTDIPEVNKEILSLHHVHLPKLADYGFVEWHRDSNLVTRGPRFDELRPLLELIIDHRDEELKTGPVAILRR